MSIEMELEKEWILDVIPFMGPVIRSTALKIADAENVAPFRLVIVVLGKILCVVIPVIKAVIVFVIAIKLVYRPGEKRYIRTTERTAASNDRRPST